MEITKDKVKEFVKGTQIAYIPNHANGYIDHPDVQYGFVTSQTINGVFCRYWSKKPTPTSYALRTTANSELTNTEDLRICELLPQSIINEILNHIDNGFSTNKRIGG